MTAAQNATDTATRLKTAAEFAEAWAAGEFRKVTAAEAHALGFDPESPAPLIFDTADGHVAIWNDKSREIEFSDFEGRAWAVNPETGEFRRG